MTFTLVELGVAMVTAIVVPWCVWVTVSIFNQRQQIALVRQEVGILKQIKELLSQKEFV